MSMSQVIVLKNKGRWVLRHAGGEKPHPTQVAALKAAVEIAYQSGKNGRPAKVMLVDAKLGLARAFWTYGQDTYPASFKDVA